MFELATVQPFCAAVIKQFWNGGPELPRDREVTLTFDDGPNPDTTPDLLFHLRTLEIKATFFVRGHNLTSARGRQILERIAADGHQVGNHTYSHLDLTKLSSSQVEDEIIRTEELICGYDHGVKLLRPPYGTQNANVDGIIARLGYRSVFWNVDSLDWHKKFKQGKWVKHVLDQVRYHNHSIVLAHDIHATTVAHFPRLITLLQRLPGTRFIPLT
jgi:peptidoglycan/xylan/chitin deacetylase (PgdA/CDA1 family)